MGRMMRATAWLLFLAASLSCFRAEAQDRAIGEVVALRGKITVARATISEQLTVGAEILRQDRIVTDADGRVKVRFVDGTVIAVGANSELVAAEYDVDASGARRSGIFSVITGLFRATVAPGAPGSRFEVQTATAIASVRSTDWMAEASDKNTGVFVFDGAVTVASRRPVAGGTVVLQPGEGTDVPAPTVTPGPAGTRGIMVAATPTAPRRWGASRIEALESLTEIQ